MRQQKALGVDENGIRKVMRGKDYAMDSLGQLGLSIMSNIVAQLTYFYTDKVGVAVGALGVVLAISKVIDALTDIFVGNMVDHDKGDNHKYYSLMIKFAIPAVAVMILLFTVPGGIGDIGQLAYILITNVSFTAILYTMIAIPFTSVQIVRTRSGDERAKMGIFRAVGSYAGGIVIALMTIPITNALGGDQKAWIIYGTLLAVAMLVSFYGCYRNGKNAEMFDNTENEEEEKVPLKEAMGILIRNKYWGMVLLFNLLVGIVGGIASTATAYYCKWIFGDDNLVAIVGAAGMVGTILGFVASQPMIKKLGAQKTILISTAGSALFALVRCFAPVSLPMYMVTGALGGAVQIPLMCLYGVICGYAVDYNEYKHGKKLVAVASGAVSFGGKVGTGLASLILSICLAIGSYDPSLTVASDAMKNSIYAFANYIPIILNVIVLVVFLGFDIEKKLPQMRKEIEARKQALE